MSRFEKKRARVEASESELKEEYRLRHTQVEQELMAKHVQDKTEVERKLQKDWDQERRAFEEAEVTEHISGKGAITKKIDE